MQKEINIFWFRRDLRFHDNPGLYQLLKSSKNVMPIYIFDDDEIGESKTNDPRVSFIYNTLKELDQLLRHQNSGIQLFRGNVLRIFKSLSEKYNVQKVYFNHSYEPYEMERDHSVTEFLKTNGVEVKSYNSQVIFEKDTIMTNQNKPYSVFGPYKRKWLQKLSKTTLYHYQIDDFWQKFLKIESNNFPGRNELGIEISSIKVKPYQLTKSSLSNYHLYKDFPFDDSTSLISPHLRYGTVSINRLVEQSLKTNEKFLSQLIWREFYTQILYFYPHVVKNSFKPRYDLISWDNNESQFQRWKDGYTGIAIIDAGMRQLNTTGYMHGRVRMLCASFLCKNLLIDWRWGEAYFAEKLLDFDLALNNGNWQWAAGSGCDAAPYFRVFNPQLQQEKFDKNYQYIRYWLEDYNEFTYPSPMVDLKLSKQKAIERYQSALRIKEIA